MSLAQEMFAIAPAYGRAGLSAQQNELLVGKARWLRLAHEAGLPVVPTIAVSRGAWTALKAERETAGGRLRAHWVATLFRLVARGGQPPALAVRTAADRHATGLMPAKLALAPPASALDAVDAEKPFGRAIDDAFASYGGGGVEWLTEADESDDVYRLPDDHAAAASGAADAARRERQIVLIQTFIDVELAMFLTRDATTGRMGPAANGRSPLGRLPANCVEMSRTLDRLAGQHLCCLVSTDGPQARLLSARPVEPSPAAELEAAVDRVELETWTRRQAVQGVQPARLALLLHPRLQPNHGGTVIATGLGVSPGAASGVVVFTPEDAARTRARGRHCILVVTETGPTDIDGMKAATGILTARGGMTSHAAVVARITGKPCVAGVRTLSVDLAEMSCQIGEHVFRAGDLLTVDGTDGRVYLDALPLSQPHIGGAIGKLLGWSDADRTIAVRTNVETVESARTALSFGAEGIGLARSEHMFFSRDRMVALRRLILSEDEQARARALTGLVDFQTEDYSAIFNTMAGRPVTVRLFDPPLHEFLPRTDDDIDETAQSLGLGVKALRLRLDRIAEVNPMLGHRGVRLAITYPEILEMQVQALMAGVRAASARQAEPVTLEIMVPFVSTAREVVWIRDRVMAIVNASSLPDEARQRFAFGTMIELPRAALRAEAIAPAVDFFSFGTNDLTQTTFGISRDDAPAFLAAYQRKGLYDQDPFVTLDRKGVGEMIAIAVERGRRGNPGLKIGICGEHAGDPASLTFFAGLGVDYVSCSPYRIPVARLALAQAAETAQPG